MTGSTLFLELLSLFQLFVVIVGVAGVFVYLGERNSQIGRNATDIDELKSIVTDLVKAQIAATTNLTNCQRMIDDLSRRIERLEATRDGRETLVGGSVG